MNEKRKILICPLDWGLGHATRCIPVIRELLKKECEVSIASSGDALALLKKEFPELAFHELTGYRPYYSGSGSLAMSLVRQLPKFMRAIRREHEEIDKIVRQESFALVISDNRYGCWSSRVPTVLITHQVNIKAPAWLSGIVNFVNRRRIKKFSACWIPDWEGTDSLSGELSAAPGIAVSYLGALSRFCNLEPVRMKYDILAIISGPEPQREIFETLVRTELKKLGKKALLVRGLPAQADGWIDGSVEEVNHLGARDLNRAILESQVILSRPGYSTIMDLSRLEKKAIFVPTPGQPEQEYLGKELMKKKITLCVQQNELNIESALIEVVPYTGFTGNHPDNRLRTVLDKILP